MADTKRKLSALLALLEIGSYRAVTAQRMRDVTVSLYANHAVTSVNENTLLTSDEDVIEVDSSGGEVTITLPDRASNIGHRYTVKRMAAEQNVILDCSGSDDIQLAADLILGTQYASVTVIAGDSTWLVVATTGEVS